MPQNSAVRIGLATLLLGILLFWTIPVSLHLLEQFPLEYREVMLILFWLCVSLIGTGVLLLLHAKFGLIAELDRRMVRDVYLEGSKDAQYSDAIYAIDVVQKLGARVIWITPTVRERIERERTISH